MEGFVANPLKAYYYLMKDIKRKLK